MIKYFLVQFEGDEIVPRAQFSDLLELSDAGELEFSAEELNVDYISRNMIYDHFTKSEPEDDDNE